MCGSPGLKYLLATKGEAVLVCGKIILKSWNVWKVCLSGFLSVFCVKVNRLDGKNDFCL